LWEKTWRCCDYLQPWLVWLHRWLRLPSATTTPLHRKMSHSLIEAQEQSGLQNWNSEGSKVGTCACKSKYVRALFSMPFFPLGF
jgi:hypothetical protein